MKSVADAVTFRYPVHLRYLLRGSVPFITLGLFLFALSYGWTSDDLLFGAFCALVGLSWWWAFRRYGLSFRTDSTGVYFLRGRASTFATWEALTAVRFSSSGASLTTNGRTWRVDSGLRQWVQLEQLLRDRVPAEALAAWLTPPFRVRTKWMGLIQPILYCAVFLLGGMNRLATGQWKAALVMLSVGVLLCFLYRGAVLWYRFGENELLIQRLASRERHAWQTLQFATIRKTTLMMSFSGGETVAIDAVHITSSVTDIFLSMEHFWATYPAFGGSQPEKAKQLWSWRKAAFAWLTVPVLVLVTFPSVIAGTRAKLGVNVGFCGNASMPDGPCRTLHLVTALLTLDFALLVFMLGLVTSIHWIGEYCNRRRDQLLAWFRPACVLLFAGTILILVAQSTLLAALLYYVPLAFANVRLSGLLIVVGIAFVLALYQMIRHAWSALHPVPLDLVAVPVQASEQPTLWQLATDVAGVLGAPPPDNILLGLEPNYFVTEARLRVETAILDGYSLYLSIPAARIMQVSEFRAVIGHEFGHFRGADTAFTTHFFPLYRSAANALTGMAQAYGAWTLLPAIYMLSFFLISFGKVQSALSRDREFLADQAGAEASCALGLASALVKLELFAPYIRALVQERVYTDSSNATAFGSDWPLNWPPTIPSSLLHESTPHPFDSHPALGQRLQKLKTDLNAVLTTPLHGDAADLFQSAATLETHLFATMRAQVDASQLSRKFTFVPAVRTPIES